MSASAKKNAKKPDRLFTILILTLVAVGIGVIVYPFVLIAVEEYNKNQVVAEFERQFPIFRAEEDFELLDEAAIAAMPVVSVPRWTSEEVASANALLDGTSIELVADLPIDLPFVPVTMPPIVSPTAAPHAPVAAHQGEMDAVELAQNLATPPDPSMDLGTDLFVQADFGNRRVLGIGGYDAQGNPSALNPAQGGADAAPFQAATEAGAGSLASQEGFESQPITQAAAGASAPLTGLNIQSGVQAGGTQGQPSALEGALETSNENAPPSETSPPPVTQAAEIDTPVFAAAPLDLEMDSPYGPGIDPRTAFQLRDAPPVYYEDFLRILDEANGLAAGLATFSPHTEERRYVDSPTELTVASINSQVRAVRTLLNIFQTLPSTRGAIAPFPSAEDPDVIYNVALGDGMQYLAADLSALDQVVNQFARIKRFPRARDQIQPGFDHSVELVDHTLNILDYMAQQLDDKDTEAYLRSRSATMVGETEAVYLLELPALKLRIGCFPNVTFEQMYSGMRKGAALYPRVGTPNTNTNISMIAHRAGSAPFFEDLDKLKPGDTVLLHTRGLGSYRYLVERVFVVEEDDWTPMHTLGYPAITLVSCEEYRGVIYGRRIMVHCKLVGIAR